MIPEDNVQDGAVTADDVKAVQSEFLSDLAGVYEALEEANAPVFDGTNTARVKWVLEQLKRLAGDNWASMCSSADPEWFESVEEDGE